MKNIIYWQGGQNHHPLSDSCDFSKTEHLIDLSRITNKWLRLGIPDQILRKSSKGQEYGLPMTVECTMKIYRYAYNDMEICI